MCNREAPRYKVAEALGSLRNDDGNNDDNYWLKMNLYYINSSEIPGELSCENIISSHVKITCCFHM